MECVKFEQFGLLYVSGELSGSETREYEAHLAECADCRRETEAYRQDSASLFTEENLGEAPSAAVDREIMRVCASPQKKFTLTLMPVFLKKYVPVTVFLMLLMVAVGGYVRYHTMTADNLSAKLTPPTPPALEEELIAETIPSIDYSEVASADSIVNKKTPSSKPLGNINVEGVVPVSGGK